MRCVRVRHLERERGLFVGRRRPGNQACRIQAQAGRQIARRHCEGIRRESPGNWDRLRISSSGRAGGKRTRCEAELGRGRLARRKSAACTQQEKADERYRTQIRDAISGAGEGFHKGIPVLLSRQSQHKSSGATPEGNARSMTIHTRKCMKCGNETSTSVYGTIGNGAKFAGILKELSAVPHLLRLKVRVFSNRSSLGVVLQELAH
jgi:hypothetical protein